MTASTGNTEALSDGRPGAGRGLGHVRRNYLGIISDCERTFDITCSHIHVFDPKKFPYPAKRSYTPGEAQVSEYPSKNTGCTNVVVVHASVQGSSPALLVDTLQRPHNESNGLSLRGLATIDPHETTDAELDKLHSEGVRGVRFHKMAWGHGVQSGGADIIREVGEVARRVARMGWVIDVFCPLAAWAHMADFVRSLDPRIKVVADHFGGTFPGDENGEDFGTLLGLIREKSLTVKISGFERLYHGHVSGMLALERMAKAIFEAGPDQIIYGSDWPYTGLGVQRQGKTEEQRLNEIEGFRDVPDADHIRTLREWIKDDTVWEKLFVRNAERLFD